MTTLMTTVKAADEPSGNIQTAFSIQLSPTAAAIMNRIMLGYLDDGHEIPDAQRALNKLLESFS